jgi:hypothetical protein
MRSRYNHEGEIDYHADTEHDILRRADEALERRRLAEQASVVAEHHSALGAVPTLGLAKLSGSEAAESPIAAATPKMPHEELAERFAAKAAPLSAASWSPSTTTSSAGNNPSRRSSR